MTVIDALGASTPAVVGYIIAGLLTIIGIGIAIFLKIFLHDMKAGQHFRHQVFDGFRQAVYSKFDALGYRCDTLDASNVRIEREAVKLDSKVEIVSKKIEGIDRRLWQLDGKDTGEKG